MKDNFFKILISIIAVFVVVSLIVFAPNITASCNSWKHDIKKADDMTNYETKKKVEDTCRSMISSYESDKLMYEQYKESDNEEKQNWAEQAKIRANKTATTYNNYILKNSYVWEDNVPSDIKISLPIIQ